MSLNHLNAPASSQQQHMQPIRGLQEFFWVQHWSLGLSLAWIHQGIFQRARYANGHQEELEDHEVLESIVLREPGPILHLVLSCIFCIMHQTR